MTILPMNLASFAGMIPTNKEPEIWFELAKELFPAAGITTPERIAGFMSQGGHESSDFRVLIENLNYSEAGLLKTFPRYFSPAQAKAFARKPQDIANRVYDDALRTNKLGNTQPGDGWRFRGSGIFQLTGRWNYEAFAKSIDKSVLDTAEYVRTKRGAMESALWYWNRNNLNRFADAKNIDGLSKAVNGGTIGLADRRARWNRALALVPSVVNSTDSDIVAKRGDPRSDLVRSIQRALRLTADGIFGKNTEAGVSAWQKSKGYPVTGKVTRSQLKVLVG